ncbi:MAG: (Fe-S)-binding protein [Ktedonobacterales bacterium]|nr:(Fe-S)-binding protein [Ktedonobacterales bacterium]
MLFHSPTIMPTGGLVGALLFGAVFVAAWASFGLRIRHLVGLLRLGQPENRLDHLPERIGFFLRGVLGQSGVLRNPIPGLAHFFTFWGFIVIQLGALNLWANGFNFSLPLVNTPVYSVILDAFLVFVTVALAIFAYRRVVLRPKELQSQTHKATDGLIILGLIFLVIFTLVGVETFNYVATSGADTTPLGSFFGHAVSGLSVGSATVLYRAFWWAHIFTVLGFLVYIPQSKHLHLLATPFNVFFQRSEEQPKGALPLIPDIEGRFEREENVGVSKVNQFTWKQLLDGYACTECGRCNAVCPALATGKPLWPKEIIIGVKEQLFSEGGLMLAGQYTDAADERRIPLVGGRIQDETLWSCTNCGACVEACPVNIDHVTKIDDMRRHLVMEEEGRFPKEVAPLFTNLERNGNPWQIRNDTRADWARDMGVKLLSDDPECEILYWVGCMGSFDQRNRKVATAFAKVLQAAKVDFAILGPEESCTGDPARRIGNEYLWQTLAQQNIETLNGYGFNRRLNAVNGDGTTAVIAPVTRAAKRRIILATCPHCFNTIKNEYPELGGDYTVMHHTQYISLLIETGKLQLPPNFDRRKLTYHDPCFVGRWNGVYDEPRKVLNVLNTDGITEMPRNRNKSFCCGGGGGRVWMEEKTGTRVNHARVQEAIDTGADAMAAACPFCITMFEDGITAKGKAEDFKVEDLAEMIARALDEAKAGAIDPVLAE